MKVLAVLLFIATLSFAQEKKEAPKAPELPKEIVARYFKAAAQQAQAQIMLDRAQKEFDTKSQMIQQLVGEMAKQCGDQYQPNLNAQGDPECVVKPKAAEPVKK
jgi:hypothetical protein